MSDRSPVFTVHLERGGDQVFSWNGAAGDEAIAEVRAWRALELARIAAKGPFSGSHLRPDGSYARVVPVPGSKIRDMSKQGMRWVLHEAFFAFPDWRDPTVIASPHPDAVDAVTEASLEWAPEHSAINWSGNAYQGSADAPLKLHLRGRSRKPGEAASVNLDHDCATGALAMGTHLYLRTGEPKTGFAFARGAEWMPASATLAATWRRRRLAALEGETLTAREWLASIGAQEEANGILARCRTLANGEARAEAEPQGARDDG